MSRRRARRRAEAAAPPPPAAPWYADAPLPLAGALVFCAALALYWGSLRYPLVFDDQHLTLDGIMGRYGQSKVSFGVRWLSYASYAWVHVVFGPDVIWQRLTSARTGSRHTIFLPPCQALCRQYARVCRGCCKSAMPSL